MGTPLANANQRRGSACRISLLWALTWATSAAAADGSFLTMRDGYFWNPATARYFIPRGVAYQTWNLPVGANQSLDQVEYDLREFKKMRANSVRCEFTWSDIQISETEYDWRRADFLVAKAEEIGLKLFVLIGYQYPPAWFPRQLMGVNNRYGVTTDPAQAGPEALSDVINYEHVEAQRIYSNHIATVTRRYRDSPAIGAWILGNEYAYFDLWEDIQKYPARRLLGFDPVSQAEFRDYLRSFYGGDLAALNENWGTDYVDFADVVMPRFYPDDRYDPGYHDLLQWRKASIADFVALGALAAQASDPNHLRTYSMVGGVYSSYDANHPCEDAATIVERCAQLGAPLHFWSVNNYPSPLRGSEMRSANFGIARYTSQVGLPVLVSETGLTSTETLTDDPGVAELQAHALPAVMLEALMSGAVGFHFFHWSDRTHYTPAFFFRERGFGIVHETREPKQPVYDNMVRMFAQLENIRIDELLGGSAYPSPEVLFFWSRNSDLVWPRANQENAMMWGVLKRLGYHLGIIDDEEFDRGDYGQARALLLSRAYQLSPEQLDRIEHQVLPSGIHVHANADLPGRFDAYRRPNPRWPEQVESIFGADVSAAQHALHVGVSNVDYTLLRVQGVESLGAISPSFREDFSTWNIWHGVEPTDAEVILTHSGLEGGAPGSPALLVRDAGAGLGRTALNTFAVGDTQPGLSDAIELFRIRHDLLKGVYRDHFGIAPKVEVRGAGAKRVVPDYRICRNGSVLISVLNEDSNDVGITVVAPDLIRGLQVENLLGGEVVERVSDGELRVTVPRDGFVLLYAYRRAGTGDDSLANPSLDKLWFEGAPLFLWPTVQSYHPRVRFDLVAPSTQLSVRLEQTLPRRLLIAESPPVSVEGAGLAALELALPDADPNHPESVSSAEGAEYVLRAVATREGNRVSEVALPVRVGWGVRPTRSLPASPVPGRTYELELRWDELPADLTADATPLERARLWESTEATQRHYRVVLELLSDGEVVAADDHLTRRGSDRHSFTIRVPSDAFGPFSWQAHLELGPQLLTRDVEESFEGRVRGASWPPDPLYTPPDPTFLRPWEAYNYTFPAEEDIWRNQGVQLEGSQGSQSAFLVITNLPSQLYSGFGLKYAFPEPWTLPWTLEDLARYSFGFDFREASGLPCIMEFQLKSANGGWISAAQEYPAGVREWVTMEATVAEMIHAGGAGVPFDPNQVSEVVVNIAMREPFAQYVGAFDNIRFDGPDVLVASGHRVSGYRSDNDTAGLLFVRRTPDGISIEWTGDGVLQSSESVDGGWRDMSEATSPAVVEAASASRVYRLRSP